MANLLTEFKVIRCKALNSLHKVCLSFRAPNVSRYFINQRSKLIRKDICNATKHSIARLQQFSH